MSKQSDRPLSPHLQVYSPQITSVSSILHRMSGVALAIGLFFVTWGLLSLSYGRESYTAFMDFCKSPLGQIMLAGWTAAFFYHMCTGIRHFILDAGYLYERETAARSGYIVILAAALLTAGLWAYIYSDTINMMMTADQQPVSEPAIMTDMTEEIAE